MVWRPSHRAKTNVLSRILFLYKRPFNRNLNRFKKSIQFNPIAHIRGFTYSRSRFVIYNPDNCVPFFFFLAQRFHVIGIRSLSPCNVIYNGSRRTLISVVTSGAYPFTLILFFSFFSFPLFFLSL